MSSSPEGGKLSFRLKACFAVGHVLNDLCASCWFSYLLIYLHRIRLFNNADSGLLLLIGQIADGLATPVVGKLSDSTSSSFGKRKIWILFGPLLVASSFPFIFNKCLLCSYNIDLNHFYHVLYYAVFIMLFQFGWAACQVCHLALVPELTTNIHIRTVLNSARYAFTVISNLTVFILVYLLLQTGGHASSELGPEDADEFSHLSFIVIAVGSVAMLTFLIGVPEKSSKKKDVTKSMEDQISFTTLPVSTKWSKWFTMGQFYPTALVYTCTRLCVNVSQVFLPFYLLDTLDMEKEAIAEVPLVLFFASLLTTTFLKPLTKKLGSKVVQCFGYMFFIGTCVHMSFLDASNSNQAFIVAICLGVGAGLLLVSALDLVNHLIGGDSAGAFVVGVMSFCDKVSNGIAVIVIQRMAPDTICKCNMSVTFYKIVMVYVPGVAAVVGICGILALWFAKPRQIVSLEVPSGEKPTEDTPLLN